MSSKRVSEMTDAEICELAGAQRWGVRHADGHVETWAIVTTREGYQRIGDQAHARWLREAEAADRAEARRREDDRRREAALLARMAEARVLILDAERRADLALDQALEARSA